MLLYNKYIICAFIICICFKDNIILAGGREIACLFLFSACLLSLMMVGEDEDMCCWETCCWEMCRWETCRWEMCRWEMCCWETCCWETCRWRVFTRGVFIWCCVCGCVYGCVVWDEKNVFVCTINIRCVRFFYVFHKINFRLNN